MRNSGLFGVRIATAAFVLLGLVLPVQAGTFTLPKGCAAYVTVQSRGCKVAHHYTCRGDAPGEQHRVDIGPQGPYFVSKIDHEAQWLDSMNLWDQVRQVLQPNPRDPASFSELLSTGTDAFDFGQVTASGTVTKVNGFDTLTGRKVVIDGVELEETSFQFLETNARGDKLTAARGNEYIHRKWRLFFSGPSEFDNGAGFEAIDRSPVRFDLPSDPGFLSDTPEFDCTLQMSNLEVRP